MAARTDALGVDARVGDTVTIGVWGGHGVRKMDVGRRAVVEGFGRPRPDGTARLILAHPGDGEPSPIARGEHEPVTYVLVARRDGQPGHEGNKPAHIEVRTQVVQRCSACGSDAEHHVTYVREHGKCVL
jgi:hypothetical protein